MPPYTLPDYIVTHCLDWIQYTVPFQHLDYANLSPNQIRNVCEDASIPGMEFTGEILKPVLGYTQAWGMAYGRVMYSPAQPGQKVLVQITGRDCGANYFRTPTFYEKALAYLNSREDAHITRIDIAADWRVDDDKATGEDYPRRMADMLDAGEITTKARSTMSIRGVKDGQPATSVYFGSATSDRRLVVYNKAREQGVAGDWVRGELRLHGARARQFVTDAWLRGIAPTYKAHLSEYVGKTSLPWFEAMRTGERGELSAMPSKQTDPAKWLRNVIFPLVERVVREEYETGIEDTLDSLEMLYRSVRDLRDFPHETSG